MQNLAISITKLSGLEHLVIGHHSPPTDILSNYILRSISEANIKVLDLTTSSPVLVQDAFKIVTIMPTLNTFYLFPGITEVS